MDSITKHLKNPFAGLNQLLGRVNLPGFDAAGIVDARRKDIDAVLEANRIVYAGAQALAQKQLEILRATMAAARSAVTDGTFSGSPMEIAGKQRDLMTKAFQLSVSHMRELAEIVRKAQADAFAVVKGQVEEDIRNLVGRVQRKGKAAAPAAAAPVAKAKVAKAKVARKPRAKARPAAKTAAKPAAKPTAKKAAAKTRAKKKAASKAGD
jgi:phasin family protein